MSFTFLFNVLLITGFSLGGGLVVTTLFFVVFEIYDLYILGETREKKNIRKDRIAYGITPKGTSILHTFKEFKQILPVEETPKQIQLII